MENLKPKTYRINFEFSIARATGRFSGDYETLIETSVLASVPVHANPTEYLQNRIIGELSAKVEELQTMLFEERAAAEKAEIAAAEKAKAEAEY